MRKVLNGTVTVYTFVELDREAQDWVINHYYRFGMDDFVGLLNRKKIEEYFEGVEFYKDGAVYEEV